VVAKREANAQGTNRRTVVTNRPGAFVLPEATYGAYADRGESENRNKELQRGLQADRLRDHRYFASLFRLYLHVAVYNLLVRLGHVTADPPPASPLHDVPSEALGGSKRRQMAQPAPRARSVVPCVRQDTQRATSRIRR
jgi:hypothetical protein